FVLTVYFFFQAEDGIRDFHVTGVQTCALPIYSLPAVTTGPNQSICLGGSVQLQAAGAIAYSWTPSAGLSCTTCPNPSANPLTTRSEERRVGKECRHR